MHRRNRPRGAGRVHFGYRGGVTTLSSGVRFHENVHGIYFDDLDAFQILHNARYLLLIERTIGSFWQRLGWGSWRDMQENVDAQHLVRENHIEYLRPVVGTGEVRVRIWIERLGRSSLVFGFCVMPMDEDVDFAVGTRALVRIDVATRTPTAWTDAFRAKVTPYLRAGRGDEPR
jgi:acyl-CoA thioester hydrolase